MKIADCLKIYLVIVLSLLTVTLLYKPFSAMSGMILFRVFGLG